jgi:hypothetical protein
MKTAAENNAMPEAQHTCVRCREKDVSGPLSLCADCSIATKDECSSGLIRLGQYLAAWAAFEEWLRRRGQTVR